MTFVTLMSIVPYLDLQLIYFNVSSSPPMKKDKRLPCLLIFDCGKIVSTDPTKSQSTISSLSDLCLGVLVLRLLFLGGLGLKDIHLLLAVSLYFNYGFFLRGATLSMTINLCLDIHD